MIRTTLVLIFIFLIILTGCSEKTGEKSSTVKENISKIKSKEASDLVESFFKRPHLKIYPDYIEDKNVKLNGNKYYYFYILYEIEGAYKLTDEIPKEVLVDSLSGDIYSVNRENNKIILGEKLN